MRCCPKRKVDMFHEPERDAGSSMWSTASGQPRILLLINIHVQLACCSTIPTPCLTVINFPLLGKQHIAVIFNIFHIYCIFKMVGGQDKTQNGSLLPDIENRDNFGSTHVPQSNFTYKAHMSFIKATQSGLYSTEEKAQEIRNGQNIL